MPQPADPTARLAARLAEAGLDLIREFPLDDDACALFPFERFGRPRSRGYLVGNTRALWAPFLAWLRQQDPMPKDPVDTYVESSIERAVAALTQASEVRVALYWSHRTNYQGTRSEPTAVPIQRLARHIGLCALSPVQLSVHETYGPWISLRAVICVDWPAQAHQDAPKTAPCDHCPRPCEAPFRTALARAQSASDASLSASVKIDWRLWLEVRQSCPVGRDFEYPADQSAYHYLADPALLRQAGS